MALAVVLVGDPDAGGRVRPAEAQQARFATIKVAPVTRVEAATRHPLAVEVGPATAIAKNSFVRIRGVPPTVALTEGHAIAPGAWAVPLVALPTLSLIVPVGLEGSWEISIHLVSMEGAMLAEAKMTLVVAAAPRTARPDPPARSPPVPAPPILSSEERERALGLHARGAEQLERGNIYAARKFFERAAEAGLAQSAIAVAATYDPHELGRLNVVGLQPDIAAARRWYEKARELGAVEAGERLARLGPR